MMTKLYLKLNGDLILDHLFSTSTEVPAGFIESASINYDFFIQLDGAIYYKCRYVDGIFEGIGSGELSIEADYVSFKMAEIRNKRNTLLTKSDFSQLEDSNFSETDKLICKVYRQELRDLPENTADLSNPIWPTVPSCLA